MSTSTGQNPEGKPEAKPGTKTQDRPLLFISSSPHIGSTTNTRILMQRVLFALAPISVFAVALYGVSALWTILVSVVSAELAEALFRKITRQAIRNRDLSAAVSGLLLALILPPGMPLWMTAMGAAFAIIVAKEFFGGLGANVFNPALIGRAFLLMSFPVATTSWTLPRAFYGAGTLGAAADALSKATPDVLSSATPLQLIRSGIGIAEIGSSLAAAGLAAGSSYLSTIWSFFLGFRSGCIGESSIILILFGFIYLLASKTIDWRAPVSMVVSVFVFSLLFGRDPLFSILAGGALFGAVFMTTDYVTSPLTSSGKLIFGFGAGLVTVLIRQWGNYPEGVTYGILIMNAVVPYLNKFLQKKYGYIKPQKAAKTDPANGGSK